MLLSPVFHCLLWCYCICCPLSCFVVAFALDDTNRKLLGGLQTTQCCWTAQDTWILETERGGLETKTAKSCVIRRICEPLLLSIVPQNTLGAMVYSWFTAIHGFGYPWWKHGESKYPLLTRRNYCLVSVINYELSDTLEYPGAGYPSLHCLCKCRTNQPHSLQCMGLRWEIPCLWLVTFFWGRSMPVTQYTLSILSLCSSFQSLSTLSFWGLRLADCLWIWVGIFCSLFNWSYGCLSSLPTSDPRIFNDMFPLLEVITALYGSER